MVIFVMAVSGQQAITKVTYRLNPAGYACGTLDSNSIPAPCNGGWDREITGSYSATNVIAQEANVLLEYDSSTLGMWISLISSSLYSGSPCTVPAIAAAVADNLHSGASRGVSKHATDSLATSIDTTTPGKLVNIAQASGKELDSSKVYHVCYASGDGSISDATWAFTGIKIRVSRLVHISSYGVKHRSMIAGAATTIPNHPSLTMYYQGPLLNDRWISFVDTTLGDTSTQPSGSVCSGGATSCPCEKGTIAAGYKAFDRSGPIKATGVTFIVDTASLSSSKIFAVCYTESGGITSSTWSDSGIRIKRSAITKMAYGVEVVKFGDGSRIETWNRNTDDPNPIATSKIPNEPNMLLQWVGSLPSGSWISLVDASLMDYDGTGTAWAGNPCQYPAIAGGTATISVKKAFTAGTDATSTNDNRLVSGAAQGKLLDQTGSGDVVKIAQGSGNLLDPTKTYAVCYATVDGSATDSSWSDSYIRYKVSMLASLTHHSMIHGTTAHLPNTGVATWNTWGTKLNLVYAGSVPNSVGTLKFAFVHSANNPVTTNSITINEPCLGAGASSPNTAASTTGLFSGAITSSTVSSPRNYGNRVIEVDTSVLHTGTIVGTALTKTWFAVCYSTNSGTTWFDSGIRAAVAKVQQIKYGTLDSPYLPRVMLPQTASGLVSGQANAENVIAQAASQTITYVSDVAGSQGALTGSTVMGNDGWISLVEASLNGNKPCIKSQVAAAPADAQHSGPIQATTGTKNIIIPQSTLLDAQKTFAVCYAITSGSIADDTWQDSYVRVTISKVQSLSSISVTHKVNGYAGYIAHREVSETRDRALDALTSTTPNLLDIQYAGQGTIVNSITFVTLVDALLSTRFPCGENGYSTVGTSRTIAEVATGETYTHSGGSVASTSDVTANIAAGTATDRVAPVPGTQVALFQTSALGTETGTAPAVMGYYAFCYSESTTVTDPVWYDTGIRVRKSEVARLISKSDYSTADETYRPAEYDRFYNTVFHATNVMPLMAGSGARKFIYEGVLAQSKSLFLKDASFNSNNPCVKGTGGETLLTATGWAGTGAGKTVNVNQATWTTWTEATTMAVCYSVDGTTSIDTYVRFSISKVAKLSFQTGAWSSTAGVTMSHITYGQLPNQAPNAYGQDVTLVGMMSPTTSISFVDSEAASTTTTVFGISYYRACTTGTNAASAKDSTHSGVLTAASSVIKTLDSTDLSKSKLYAVCYNGTFGWIDSGIRVTFSKVNNLQLGSGYTGINAREMTSTFFPTNVLSQSASLTLRYRGDLISSFTSGTWLSVVDATLSNNNPCVVGATAASAASTTSSGVLAAAAGSTSVTLNSATLDVTKTFALCYSGQVGAGANADASSRWHDSSIRFKISKVTSLVVGGVTITTTGQIPNINAADLYKISYVGTLANANQIAFSDERQGVNAWTGYFSAGLSYEPCSATYAAGTISALQSGPVTAVTATKDVTAFNTVPLDTLQTYAVCYKDGVGGTWFDSGLRVTVTKVWNMLLSSGVTGPACVLPTQGPVNAACKLDTKPRDMTSLPLATNTLPNSANMALTYVGTLTANSYISIVVATANSANPCASGLEAGAAADSTHSGPTRAPAGSNLITIAQSVALANGKYAVCYDEVGVLPPMTFATVLTNYQASGSSYPDGSVARAAYVADATVVAQSTKIGTTLSSTWRDSFIRLTVSEIDTLKVSLSMMPVSNTYTYQNIITYGQIPNTAPSTQTHFQYQGTLGNGMSIALIDATSTAVADTDTSISRAMPCSVAATVTLAGATSTTTIKTGAAASVPGTKFVFGLDTTYLDPTKVFALCYTKDSGTNYLESGIRITVPHIIQVKYLDLKFGNPTSQAMYTRTLSSITLSTNMFPQFAGQQMTYNLQTGATTVNAWLSLVDTTINSNFPCHNPALVAAASSATTTGSSQAAAKTATFGMSTLLGGTDPTDKIFTVCYSIGATGTTTDWLWRDTFIRFSLSQVESIMSYKISHRVMGQIPNHATLKIDYAGTLDSGMYLSIVDATLSQTQFTIGGANGLQSPFPCMSVSNTADSAHSAIGVGTAGGFPAAGIGKTTTIDTTALDTTKTFAICYSGLAGTGVIGTASGKWVDSGIRVTVPAIYNFMRDSGYSGLDNTLSGTAQRDQKSWDQSTGASFIVRPTSTHPVLNTQKVIYVLHSTAAASNGAWISVVDASSNTNDPCTVRDLPSGNGATGVAPSSISASDVSLFGFTSGPSKGQIQAGGADGKVVLLQTADLAATANVYAICYTLTSAGTLTANFQASNWRDSYVRIKLSKLSSFTVAGVTHRTFGQIPNVAASDLMTFTYSGGLANNRWLMFISETMYPTANNVGNPCSAAPTTPANAADDAWYASNSGPQQAGASNGVISSFDTQRMSTDKVFAVCYNEGATSNNANWVDSGIRVTVPRIWNMKYSSGFSGPACPMVKPDNSCSGIACADLLNDYSRLNPGCKLDTKDRDMTSKPLSTNRFPRSPGEILTYVGRLAVNNFVSLVDASQNSNNPCVTGTIAGAAAGAGGGTDARISSGPVQANSRAITIAQAANNLLDSTKIFAVCYDDGVDVVSTAYVGHGVTSTVYGSVTPTQMVYVYTDPNPGTSTSKTWRDSYVRLVPSDIRSLQIQLTQQPFATGFTSIAIRTNGQIPNQSKLKQTSYIYDGALAVSSYLSLVKSDDSISAETDTLTGISVSRPCTKVTTGNNDIATGINAGLTTNTFTGPVQALSATKQVYAFDTTALLTTATYALCYSTTGAVTGDVWKDSGIRINVPKMTSLSYVGGATAATSALAVQVRLMTSIVTALNKFPRAPGNSVWYSGDLATGKFVSLVAADLNGGNPCVNPTVAAAAADTKRTGVVAAVTGISTAGQTVGAKTVIFPQTTLLAVGDVNTGIYAACYSETDGGMTDLTWRDSFIRLTISEVETVTSFQVQHRTFGQIADHPRLTITYGGSLSMLRTLSLVQADQTIGNVGYSVVDADGMKNNYAFPCNEANAEGTASSLLTGASSAASGKDVTFNTQMLQRWDAATTGGAYQQYTQEYAVCYTPAASLGTSSDNTVWYDAGIRLTIADVYELMYQSGNTGPTDKEDTMPRHMSSSWLPTNVLPQEAGMVVTYATSHTAQSAWTSGTAKWISLVDATLNGNDPCTLSTTAAAAASSTASGPSQAGAGSKAVTLTQATLLDDSKTYAVCYAGSAYLSAFAAFPATIRGMFGTTAQTIPTYDGSTTDGSWRDSYIRLKISRITTVSMLGVTHRTVGQIPNTGSQLGQWNQPANLAATGMYMEYTGSLANGKKLALVDASLNANNPCGSPTIAAASSYAAGGANKQIATLDTSAMATTLPTRPTTNDWRYLTQTATGLAYAWGDTTSGAYAVCYAVGAGDAVDATWSDSGIRLTISKLHTATYASGYTGTRARVMTANRASTNRIPRIPNVVWTYSGALGLSQKVSLVRTTVNSANPCVHPLFAAATVTSDATLSPTPSPSDARVFTGAIVASGSTITIPQGSTNLLLKDAVQAIEFALCYTEGTGSTTDTLWRDSYIRVVPSDISSFANMLVTHKTYGMVTAHAAGSTMPNKGTVFEYAGALANAMTIALVDETLGTENFAQTATIAQPCDCQGTACNTLSKIAAADWQRSGAKSANSGTKQVDTLNTLYLSSTVFNYALCYSEDGNNFHDSGIRLTVPKVTGIAYSGYNDADTRSYNKLHRLMQSMVPSLQPSDQVVANVLPTTSSTWLTYNGDLVISRYISLVAVTPALNNYNPCVNPAEAAAVADTKHSGVSRSCMSISNRMDPCPAAGRTPVLPYSLVGMSEKRVFGSSRQFANNAFGTATDNYVCVAFVPGGYIKLAYRATAYTTADCAAVSTWVVSMTNVGDTVGKTQAYYVTGATAKIMCVQVFASNTVTNASLTVEYFADDAASPTGSTANKVVEDTVTCWSRTIIIANPDTWLPASYLPKFNVGNYPDAQVGSILGNKQVKLNLANLDTSLSYAVCYSDTPSITGEWTVGGTNNDNWRDSYIRITLSNVHSLTALGVTSTDHGFIPDYEDSLLTNQLTFAGAWSTTLKWFSLVDETLNSNSPCTAGAVAAAAHTGSVNSPQSGPTQASSVYANGLGGTITNAPIKLSSTIQYAVCYTTTATGTATDTWADSGIRIKKSKITKLRYNNAQLPTAAYTTTDAQFMRDHTTSRTTLGGTGYNRIYSSRLLHKLPQSADGSALSMSYNGDLTNGQVISVVSTALNNGDPCAKASVAAGPSGATSSGPINANTASTKEYGSAATAVNWVAGGPGILTGALFASALRGLSAVDGSGNSIEYTICYGEGVGADTQNLDILYSGRGHYGMNVGVTVGSMTTTGWGWRDSFIRFTLTKVEYITSHQIKHFTQGHVANNGDLGITSVGTLPAGKWISLVEETVNSNNPCASAAQAAALADNAHSGPANAPVGTNKHVLDTTQLNHNSQYAVCYSEGGTTSSIWYESGIRVTVSAMTAVQFNNEQQGTLTTGQYIRTIDSSNLCTMNSVYTCTDANPKAENRYLMQATVQFIYRGNIVNNGAGASGTSIGTENYISVVAVDTNSDKNPCADKAIAAAAATAAGTASTSTLATGRKHSGPFKATTGTRTVPIVTSSGNYLQDYDTVAICYAAPIVGVTVSGAGTVTDVTWRDSYIRLKVSSINMVTSYGIGHQTYGMIASKPALRFLSTSGLTGRFATGGFLNLVSADLNNYQPCDGMATLIPTATTISGASTENVNNKHYLRTNSLSAAKTFALCYAQTGGTASDPWRDSGIRLQTPKLTNILYSNPVNNFDASTCFLTDDSNVNIDLYGPANCKGGIVGSGPTASGGSTAYRKSQLPRDSNIVIQYVGPATNALANAMYVALVEHTLGKQANNPCRDADQTTAAASSDGSSDARLRSGPLQATNGTSLITIPQTTNPGGLLLDDTKTFAVCYGEGTNDSWRDSYIRVTMSKVTVLEASNMQVTTRGAFANVPSVQVKYTGTLPAGSWITLVDALENTGYPCDKAYAGVAASNRPYTATQDRTGTDNKRTPAMQAGPGEKTIAFDTSKLWAAPGTTAGQPGTNYYHICYAEGDGSTTDTTWLYSGLSVRFVRWLNGGENRFVSGASSLLLFATSSFVFNSNDKMTIMKGTSDCSTAYAAPDKSDGTKVKRSVAADGSVAMPSGTYVTNPQAIAYKACTYGACDAAGAYQDLNFQEGSYILCFCDSDFGDGLCDQANEYIQITRLDSLGPANPPIKIITTPVIGRITGAGTPYIAVDGYVRAVENVAHVYNLLGSQNMGYELANGDKIFFRQGDCLAVPSANSGYETNILSVTNYDSISTSSTFQSVRVTLPATLTAHSSGAARSLAVCYATAESVSVNTESNDFVRLVVSLEVIRSPRLGPIATPGHIRAISGSSPKFRINSLKLGDIVFFKKMATAPNGVSDDCKLGTYAANGLIVSAIPLNNSASATMPIQGTDYMVNVGDIDITVNRNATQSSTMAGGLASRALDRRPDLLLYSSASCTQTNPETNPWWRLDLFTSQPVARVVVTNRLADVQTALLNINLNDFVVTLGPDAGDWKASTMQLCSTGIIDKYTVGYGQTVTVLCGVAGRYLFVTLPGVNKVLSLCEVIVYGGVTPSGKVTLPALNTGAATPIFLATCFIPAGTIATLNAGSNCPVDSPYVAVGGGSNTNGGTCDMPIQAVNSVLLVDELQVFVEPTDSLISNWPINNVYELKFTQPQFGVIGTKTYSTGKAGDFIVLQKSNCNGIIKGASAYLQGNNARSGTLTLQDYYAVMNNKDKASANVANTYETGGAAMVLALAQGKVNQLPLGTYQICYATSESEGDDSADFKALAKPVVIETTWMQTATLSVPRSVLLGTDIVVHWEAPAQLDRGSTSWIGLYINGSCMGGHDMFGLEWDSQDNHEYEIQVKQSAISQQTLMRTPGKYVGMGKYVESDQHECFIAQQIVEAGVNSGVVRFSQKDYKTGGQFNARFFQGSKLKPQGRVCKGMVNVDSSDPYVRCALEPDLISEMIEIWKDPASVDAMDVIPGMEVLFSDQRGRFQKNSRRNLYPPNPNRL